MSHAVSRTRRIALIALIAVSVAALALAALLRWFVPDRVVKTPLSTDTALILHGTGQIFDAESSSLVTKPFVGIQILQADSKASDDTNVAFNAYSCLVIDEGGTPQCLRISTTDPNQPGKYALSDRVALNRKTGEPVDDPKYGANINGAPVAGREGLTYRFPFDTQKHSYQFFNTFLKKDFEAKYVDEVKVGGLSTYEFVITTPTTPAVIAQTSPPIKGTYQDTTTVFVEPRTGTIVNAQEHEVLKASDGSTALDVRLDGGNQPLTTNVVELRDGQPTTVSVHTPLWWAKDGIDKIDMLTVTGPLVLLGLGVVTGLAAAWLTWPPRRRKNPTDAEPTPRTLAPVG